MAAGDHLQGSLFHPSETYRRPDPGEQHPADWLRRDDVYFHGTWNPHSEDAPTRHYGGHAVAMEMVGYRQPPANPDVRFDDWGGGIDTVKGDEGVIHARRIPETTSEIHSDHEANSIDALHLWEGGANYHDLPRSVVDSMFDDVREDLWEEVDDPDQMSIRGQRMHRKAGKTLGRDVGVRYDNRVEQGVHRDLALDREHHVERENPIGPNDVYRPSVVATQDGVRSWEEDVVASPHASTMARGFAQDRLDRGQKMTAPIVRQEARPPVQLNLLNNRYNRVHPPRRWAVDRVRRGEPWIEYVEGNST